MTLKEIPQGAAGEQLTFKGIELGELVRALNDGRNYSHDKNVAKWERASQRPHWEQDSVLWNARNSQRRDQGLR